MSLRILEQVKFHIIHIDRPEIKLLYSQTNKNPNRSAGYKSCREQDTMSHPNGSGADGLINGTHLFSFLASMSRTRQT